MFLLLRSYICAYITVYYCLVYLIIISAKTYFLISISYCAFHKHANSKIQKPPSQLRFSLPSIIITITSNEPWNTETHKTDRNPPITNQKPWPFEPVKVKFCFLRGLLRWLMTAKNAIVSWLLNFRIRMLVKSAVNISMALLSLDVHLILLVFTWRHYDAN